MHIFRAVLASSYSIVYFTILLVFFVVTRAMCICYDDWTAKMLDWTQSPRRSVQLNLLQKLKARVALCALVTRKTRVLLLPPMLAVVSLFLSFLQAVIDPSRPSVMTLIVKFLNVGFM